MHILYGSVNRDSRNPADTFMHMYCKYFYPKYIYLSWVLNLILHISIEKFNMSIPCGCSQILEEIYHTKIPPKFYQISTKIPHTLKYDLKLIFVTN